jgi:hypothetical protein
VHADSSPRWFDEENVDRFLSLGSPGGSRRPLDSSALGSLPACSGSEADLDGR